MDMETKVKEIIEKFNSQETKNNLETRIDEFGPAYSIVMRDLITTDEFRIYINYETKMVEFETNGDSLQDDGGCFEVPFKNFASVAAVIGKLIRELNK